jgi:hypothetical protein
VRAKVAAADTRAQHIHLCAVRILKAQKRMEISTFSREIESQMSHRFALTAEQIAESVEYLKEKEYCREEWEGEVKWLEYLP